MMVILAQRLQTNPRETRIVLLVRGLWICLPQFEVRAVGSKKGRETMLPIYHGPQMAQGQRGNSGTQWL